MHVTSYRDDFARLYGVPTNVDAVWADRLRHQDMLNRGREHLRDIERAMWFGRPDSKEVKVQCP